MKCDVKAWFTLAVAMVNSVYVSMNFWIEFRKKEMFFAYIVFKFDIFLNYNVQNSAIFSHFGSRDACTGIFEATNSIGNDSKATVGFKCNTSCANI